MTGGKTQTQLRILGNLKLVREKIDSRLPQLNFVTTTTTMTEPSSSKAQSQLTPTQLRNARKRRAKKAKQKTGIANAKDPSLQYIACPTQTPILQAARQFFAKHRVPFAIYDNNKSHKGWRTMCKLAVVPSNNSKKKWTLGLYAPHTHTVVPGTDQSVAHHPALNQAVRRILECDCCPPAYTPDTNSGVRYLLLSLERSTQRVQLTLVVSSSSRNSDSSIQTFIDTLVLPSRVQWHSIWVHGNEQDRHCNAIVDVQGTWECRYHPATKPLPLCEYLGGNNDTLPRIPLYFPPNVFRQANLDGFRYVVKKIHTVLAERKRREDLSFRTLLELYGGVGTIGLHVTDLFTEEYICSDANPYNPACFERSVDSNQYTNHCRCTYVPHNAHDMVPEYLSWGVNNNKKNADVIIVDPPRKGLEPTVAAALANGCCCAHTLVYVSCGFAAFERDCAVLIEQGVWVLDQAEGHVLFPGSDAIETLAIFRNKNNMPRKRERTMTEQATNKKRRRRGRR